MTSECRLNLETQGFDFVIWTRIEAVPKDWEILEFEDFETHNDRLNTANHSNLSCFLDHEGPKITCPPSLSVYETQTNEEGQSYATVFWNDPEATDNSGISPTTTCSQTSGNNFEIGETKVVCKARDLNGNQETCFFTIEVVGK